MVAGLRMHHAEWPWPFPCSTAVHLHNVVGIGLPSLWLVFLFGNRIGDTVRRYRIPWPQLLPEPCNHIRWYTRGIFAGEPHFFKSVPTASSTSCRPRATSLPWGC